VPGSVAIWRRDGRTRRWQGLRRPTLQGGCQDLLDAPVQAVGQQEDRRSCPFGGGETDHQLHPAHGRHSHDQGEASVGGLADRDRMIGIGGNMWGQILNRDIRLCKPDRLVCRIPEFKVVSMFRFFLTIPTQALRRRSSTMTDSSATYQLSKTTTLKEIAKCSRMHGLERCRSHHRELHPYPHLREIMRSLPIKPSAMSWN